MPSRLHELIIACGFDAATLERITQTSLGTGLNVITTAKDPGTQASAIIDWAAKYDLLRELTAAVLYTGADRPCMQNALLGNKFMTNSTVDPHDNNPHETSGNAVELLYIRQQVTRTADRIEDVARRVQQIEIALQIGIPSRSSSSERIFMALIVTVSLLMLLINAYIQWGHQ